MTEAEKFNLEQQEILNKVFNKDGSFKNINDPYRIEESEKKDYDLIFTKDGDLDMCNSHLEEFIKKNNCSFDSDIVKLYYADEFAMNTHGNYTAIFMWR